MALVVIAAILEFRAAEQRVRVSPEQGAGVLYDIGELIQKIHFHPNHYQVDGELAVISKNIPLIWWEKLEENAGIRIITDSELHTALSAGPRVSLFELRLGAPTVEDHDVIWVYSADYFTNSSGELFVNYGKNPAMFSIVKTHGEFRPVYIPPVSHSD